MAALLLRMDDRRMTMRRACPPFRRHPDADTCMEYFAFAEGWLGRRSLGGQYFVAGRKS
jgi:hypothetical protein